MLVLRSREVTLTRPVRLLHPRIPVYLVPRGEGRTMVGATMIESASRSPVSARSLMELLGAAYAVHPAFGEAERSEEHTSELQSLMRISYAVFCLKKKNKKQTRSKSSITTNNT